MLNLMMNAKEGLTRTQLTAVTTNSNLTVGSPGHRDPSVLSNNTKILSIFFRSLNERNRHYGSCPEKRFAPILIKKSCKKLLYFRRLSTGNSNS